MTTTTKPLPLALTFAAICAIDPFYPYFNSGLSLVLGCAAGGYVVNYLLKKHDKADFYGIDVSGVMKDVSALQGGTEGALIGLVANLGQANSVVKGAIGFLGPFVYEKLL